MTGAGHLLIADCRKTETGSDVQDLVAKLHRRGFWTTLLLPDAALPAGALGVAVFLDDSADRSHQLKVISGRAQSVGIPVVALHDAPETSRVASRLPPNVIIVHGRDADRDRALSRFANAIAGAVADRAATGATDQTSVTDHRRQSGQEPVESGPVRGDNAVWSWPGALLGPLWPVAMGRPLAGFLGLALLIAGTVVAASLSPSPLAPLVGFACAWLTFMVLMGLFGGPRTAGEAVEIWFRPAGTIALGVVVGFVALVGWSKAQIERVTLQPQAMAAEGNPVLIGRASSGWTWDSSWMSDIGDLPFINGGQNRPAIEGDPVIGDDVNVPSSSPTIPSPQGADDDCTKLKEQAGSNWENDPTYNTFCGGQPKVSAQ